MSKFTARFEDLRKAQKAPNAFAGTFARTLLAGDDAWFLALEETPQAATQEIKGEKAEVLRSLEQFAIEKARPKEDSPRPKLRFPGGELEVKDEKTARGLKLKRNTLSRERWPDEIRSCSECPEALLCERGEVVTSALPENPLVLFVGSFPKNTEQNEPFAGPSGDLLKKMAHAMGLAPHEYHIALMVKCAPPGEDSHNASEMARECLGRFFQELELLRPKVVVSLGAFATNLLLGKNERLTKTHGKVFEKEVSFSDGKALRFSFVPVFHPEFLLINPNMKRLAWQDLQKVMELIGRPVGS